MAAKKSTKKKGSKKSKKKTTKKSSKKTSSAKKTEKKEENKLNRYEVSRLIGARALQIASGAPFFVELKDKDLKRIQYNPIRIAEMEYEEGMLPITVKEE